MQIDSQTDRQTDSSATECISKPHSRLIINSWIRRRL